MSLMQLAPYLRDQLGDVAGIMIGTVFDQTGIGRVGELLRDHHADLARMVRQSYDRVWGVLGRAVKPQPWREQKVFLISWLRSDERIWTREVRDLLEREPDWQSACASELSIAREHGLFQPTSAKQASRHHSSQVLSIPEELETPAQRLERVRKQMDTIAETIDAAGLTSLRRLLEYQFQDGSPLLLGMFRSFLQTAIQHHPKLGSISLPSTAGATTAEPPIVYPPTPTPVETRRALPAIFMRKRLQLEQLQHSYQRIHDEISRLSLAGATTFQPDGTPIPPDRIAEAENYLAKLREAIGRFDLALSTPCISIATTGTTSAGKSTLINLICGAELMPRANGEMSAGVVRIHHSAQRKLLLRPTVGIERLIEREGDWEKLPDGMRIIEAPTDEIILDRLTHIMKQYNGLRAVHQEPPCPQIELYYPTRLGMRSDLLGLPEGCTYVLMDLPGVKYLGDEGNSQIIREHGRDSLCLVLYNAFETDPTKQKDLLEELSQQVKKLSASPHRMLFILNRIDVFLTDRNSAVSESEYVLTTRERICNQLRKDLPAHTTAINAIQTLRLSSLPAFRAQTAIECNSQSPQDQEKRLRALSELDRFFAYMIPDFERSRNPKLWSPQQAYRVADSAWQASHGPAFYRSLREHVQTHLPVIVIPPAMMQLQANVGESLLAWMMRVVQAEINGSRERYAAECERIRRVGDDLTQFRAQSDRLLLDPAEQMQATLLAEDGQHDSHRVRRMAEALRREMMGLAQREPYNQLPEGTLVPLYNWRDNLSTAVSRLLAEIQTALLNGDPLSGSITDQLPAGTRKGLIDAVNTLRDKGYNPTTARNGEEFQPTSAADHERLSQIRAAVTILADRLKIALADVVSRESCDESDRVFQAMEHLFDQHRQYVTEGSRRIANRHDLQVPLDLPSSALARLQREIAVDYALTDRDTVTHTAKEVVTGTIQVKVGEQSKTRQQERSIFNPRRWIEGKYYTEFYTEDVFADQDVIEKRNFARIISATALVERWSNDASQRDPGMILDFAKMIHQQFGEVSESIAAYQQNMLACYQAELDRIHDAARSRSESEEAAWRQVETQVQAFEQEYRAFVQPLTIEEQRAHVE